MGQQQLLLIALGVIIVGVAIFVGINLFKSNAVESKRNTLTNELVNLAGMAQQYYKKPVAMGGGGKSFTGWRVPNALTVTGNGRFEATVNANDIVLRGIGNEVVTGSDSVEVQTTVYPDSINTVIIH